MSFTLPPYEECVTNLRTFTNNLILKNPSKILFLYFTVKKTPYVRTKFGKWETKNTVYYVLPGDDQNFTYVYRDSNLKALIDIINPNSPSPFNSTFNSKAPYDHKYEVSVKGPASSGPSKNEVFVGNHLDFSIRRYKRNHNPVRVISSHLTKYEIHPNGSATRDAQVQADFTLEQITANNLDNIKNFSKIYHEVRGLSSSLTIDEIFDQDREWILPFYNLTRITLGLSQSQQGGRHVKYHTYKNRKYKVQVGKKGGEYIVVNNKRKYLKKRQVGGTLELESMVMSKAFSDILYELYLQPMQEVKKNIVGLKVLFDYGKELTEYKNDLHIVLVYEFDDVEKVDIFVIDGNILLNAIEERNSGIKEKPNLEKLTQIAEKCKDIIILGSSRQHEILVRV